MLPKQNNWWADMGTTTTSTSTTSTSSSTRAPTSTINSKSSPSESSNIYIRSYNCHCCKVCIATI